MSKAILEFILPEDKQNFDVAIDAWDILWVITDLDEWLRNEQKFQNRENITITEIRNKIQELADEHGVTKIINEY